MIWIPLLASLLAVLVATGQRYRAVGLRHAAPGAFSPVFLGVVALLVAAMLVWLGLATRRQRPTRVQAMALGELLLAFPPLFLLVWGILPSEGPGMRHLPVGVLLIGLYAWLGWRGRADREPRQTRAARARRALRHLAPATLGTMAVCAAVAVATRTAPRPTAVAISLATYPLFAALQLAVFVEIALPRLRKLSSHPTPVVLVAAGLFALAHWPNGTLMALCFCAMLLWAHTWLRAPSLSALAVSMGVAATACAQLLPADATHHMRTGPGFVLQAHRDELMHRERSLLTQLASADFYRECGSTAEAFVAGVFQRILGREPSAAELQHGVRTLELSRREEVVRGFLASPEFRARAAGAFVAPVADEDWVARLADPGWFQAQGGDWPSFVAGLYRELLGRPPTPAESANWRPDPDLTARTGLIWSYLDSDEWATHPSEPAYAVRQLGPLWMR